LYIDSGARIRFENIEISGGEGGEGLRGVGIAVSGGASVTLGQGAAVHGNNSFGVAVLLSGSCTIDGGEVRDHQFTGVMVSQGGSVTMRSGSIRNNRSTGNAGGVIIAEGGRFTMSGGAITGNRSAIAGGGVLVVSGGRFDQTGGTISNNIAAQGASSTYNVFREPGALGSNLPPGAAPPAAAQNTPRSPQPAPSPQPPRSPQPAPSPQPDRADPNEARLNSLGLTIGSSFTDPLLIVTLNLTVAVSPNWFLGLGCDVGLFSELQNADNYYSVYPFAHMAYFEPFGGGGFYIGGGGGLVIREYTAGGEAASEKIFAASFTAGYIFLDMFDISYSLRTNLDWKTSKLAVGFIKRFM
jgi:hypothetical protein